MGTKHADTIPPFTPSSTRVPPPGKDPHDIARAHLDWRDHYVDRWERLTDEWELLFQAWSFTPSTRNTIYVPLESGHQYPAAPMVEATPPSAGPVTIAAVPAKKPLPGLGVRWRLLINREGLGRPLGTGHYGHSLDRGVLDLPQWLRAVVASYERAYPPSINMTHAVRMSTQKLRTSFHLYDDIWVGPRPGLTRLDDMVTLTAPIAPWMLELRQPNHALLMDLPRPTWSIYHALASNLGETEQTTLLRSIMQSRHL